MWASSLRLRRPLPEKGDPTKRAHTDRHRFHRPLSSLQAGEVIASGWLPAAEVSVLPIGEAGGGFVTAYADLIGVTTSSGVADGIIVTTGQGPDTAVVQVRGPNRGPGIPYGQSSRPIGDVIADLLRTGGAVPDPGRSGRSLGP